jgi:putative nucleotidyltransferase with HDIG domain
MNLDQARALMHEWTQSPALRVHMEAVSACMGAEARRLAPADEEKWRVAGLLHDFDYERHPSLEEHPAVGVAHLETLGVGADIREAIMGHGDHTGAARETPMAKALFAVDELAGFIVACCKVRPDGIASLEPKSVKKKLKDKAFAAAVSREDIAQGVDALGVDLTEHIQRCVDALRASADELGLEG